jgi:cobalt/nickel transport system ATP-binding protein
MDALMNQSPEKDPIIRLTNISYAYPGSPTFVLDDLNLDFYKGERVGIMAPNGSGKTTLFYLIMGLIKQARGSIEIFGKTTQTEKDFEAIRKKIGLLFQDSDDQLFSPTVLEDVAFGPLNLGKKPEEAKQIARETLKQLGLEEFEDRITYKLSGGEKRLVSLATVLAMKPEVLLLDEPSNGLDEKTKARLIDHLSRLDLSYLVISHDHDFLFDLSQSNYTMKGGKLQPMERMHSHFHSHPHTNHTH